MTKVLVIGLGGVGVMAAYALQTFNAAVELTAIVRSDYDRVVREGYLISSVDYGDAVGFRPANVVRTLADAARRGPYDHIVVCTKIVPKERNVWDDVAAHAGLLKRGDRTNVVLLQNGVDIERLWAGVPGVNLVSGVSYISSVNTRGDVVQYGTDSVLFGLFDPVGGDAAKLREFVGLYANEFNDAGEDTNVRFTRIKKLLYNASFNTFCCLTNADVGLVYDCPAIVDEVFRPLMKEIQLVGNQDLRLRKSDQLLPDLAVDDMIAMTEQLDRPTSYEPSMLVDLRQRREIELEVILGNLIAIFKANNPGVDVRKSIPYLNFLYYALRMVQYKLERKLV